MVGDSRRLAGATGARRGWRRNLYPLSLGRTRVERASDASAFCRTHRAWTDEADAGVRTNFPATGRDRTSRRPTPRTQSTRGPFLRHSRDGVGRRRRLLAMASPRRCLATSLRLRWLLYLA